MALSTNILFDLHGKMNYNDVSVEHTIGREKECEAAGRVEEWSVRFHCMNIITADVIFANYIDYFNYFSFKFVKLGFS